MSGELKLEILLHRIYNYTQSERVRLKNVFLCVWTWNAYNFCMLHDDGSRSNFWNVLKLKKKIQRWQKKSGTCHLTNTFTNIYAFLVKINLFTVLCQKVKYQHICSIFYQFLCCLISVIRLKHLCEMLVMLVSEYLILSGNYELKLYCLLAYVHCQSAFCTPFPRL